jgi:hypothetical protein
MDGQKILLYSRSAGDFASVNIWSTRARRHLGALPVKYVLCATWDAKTTFIWPVGIVVGVSNPRLNMLLVARSYRTYTLVNKERNGPRRSTRSFFYTERPEKRISIWPRTPTICVWLLPPRGNYGLRVLLTRARGKYCGTWSARINTAGAWKSFFLLEARSVRERCRWRNIDKLLQSSMGMDNFSFKDIASTVQSIIWNERKSRQN